VTAPSSSLSPRDQIEQLQALLAATRAERDSVHAELITTRTRLQVAELRIEKLEYLRRKHLEAKYGASSERLSDVQLQLLELEPGVHRQEAQAEAGRGELPGETPETDPSQRKRRAHPGRQTLAAHLPRQEKIIPASAEQQSCGRCGGPTAVIGYVESEQLEVIPARHFVTVVKREKRACPGCPQAGVTTAPAPERIVEKSLLSDAALVDLLVAKYCDHLPLYRQSLMLGREAGVDISRATLDGLVMKVGEMLRPLTAAMRREILASGYVQADETPVPVQLGTKPGKHAQAFLWQYGSPGGATVFDYRGGRGREGPRQFLGDYAGLLQTDGYAAYGGCGGVGLLHAACWAHARRKFIEALKLNRRDADALRLVAPINRLFAIDRQAREEGLDLEARHALRQRKSAPVLAELHADLLASARQLLPASATGRAVAYTLGLWDKLTLFLSQPRLELSNNLAENSMRPIAVGRKNWIHLGSAQAGPRVAAILSVIESCRRLGLPPRAYLAAILPGLANRSHRQLDSLTPAAWAAAHTSPPTSTM